MTTELQKSLPRPLISRRDIAKSLAGRPSGDLGVDALLADVGCRARLVRAKPKNLKTLLAFSGSSGLLLVPYHPDPKQRVDCVLAPRELAMATWLGTVEVPTLTMSHRTSTDRPIEDEVSPQSALQDTVIGGTGNRQTLSIEVRVHGRPGWQVLCVTDGTTQWGVSRLNEDVKLHRGRLLGLWALLRQVAVNRPIEPPPVQSSGDSTACESLASSDRKQSQVGSPS